MSLRRSDAKKTFEDQRRVPRYVHGISAAAAQAWQGLAFEGGRWWEARHADRNKTKRTYGTSNIEMVHAH